MVIRSNILSNSSSNSGRPSTTGSSGQAALPDFNLITSNSLKTYKKIHKLRMKSTNSKSELVTAVTKHFSEMPPPENEDVVISGFLEAIKNYKAQRESAENDSDDSRSQQSSQVSKRKGSLKK